MNPNQAPVGPERSFTKKFLEAKFSVSLDRRHWVNILNALGPIQFPVGDPRAKALIEAIDEITTVAFSGISESDYEPLPGQVLPPTEPLKPEVQVN